MKERVEMKRKVYVVTSGAYSEYELEAIFSSKEKAEEFMRMLPKGRPEYNDVEEYDLDSGVVDHVKKGHFIWQIAMERDGSVVEVNKKDNECWSLCGPLEVVEQRGRGRDAEKRLVGAVWAKTWKQAIKIANDKRAQLIASGGWD